MTKFLFLILTLGPSSVLAQSEESRSPSSASNSVEMSANRPFGFNGKLTLGSAQSAFSKDTFSNNNWYFLYSTIEDSSRGFQFITILSYLQSYSAASDSADSSRSESWDNPTFWFSKKWMRPNSSGEWFFDRISLGLSGTLAGNADATQKGFRYSIGPAFETSKEMGRWNWIQTTSLSFGKYITQPDTVAPYRMAPFVAKTSAEIDFSISEKLSASAYYQQFLSLFEGSVVPRSLWAIGFAYEFSKRFNADIGFGPGVGFISPDAQSDQLNFSEKYFNQIYTEVTISL